MVVVVLLSVVLDEVLYIQHKRNHVFRGKVLAYFLRFTDYIFLIHFLYSKPYSFTFPTNDSTKISEECFGL